MTQEPQMFCVKAALWHLKCLSWVMVSSPTKDKGHWSSLLFHLGVWSHSLWNYVIRQMKLWMLMGYLFGCHFTVIHETTLNILVSGRAGSFQKGLKFLPHISASNKLWKFSVRHVMRKRDHQNTADFSTCKSIPLQMFSYPCPGQKGLLTEHMENLMARIYFCKLAD